ncbi:hypothetical protein DM01DRAFT_1340927 [Hesseltinella vesiculosa]|uniref:Hyaluronan/mRNA-binding protein domain-containing protein n=1 Tax=Hesseltinella vesiculosa TaxID=101127 RepID=A0A1X2G2U0_9FUNG|nr:hypothetical protein DM01DRAFT_1340927 [Hesseltinella vesiculosa]
MSAFSKNSFSLLSEDGEVKPEPAPVKDEPKPVVEQKPKTDKRAKAKRGNEKRRGGEKRQQGGRQRGRQFDRHSGTGIVDSEKKEKQGWGHPETAEAEAAADKLSPSDPAAPEAEAAVAEAEEKVKTLEEFLAEKANKVLKVSLPEARQIGEVDGKWKDSVAFVKEEEPDFLPAKEKSSKKEKSRKEKVFVDIEQRFQEKPRFQREQRPARGGRRNNTARRSDRRSNANVNLQDDKAFPTLGATA